MSRKNLRVTILSASVVLILSIVSCHPEAKLEKQEKENIQNYLTENSNLNFVKRSSGLYYLEVKAGTGISPVTGDSAFVKYTGMLLDGSVFDSNVTSGSSLGFEVGDMIVGFNEGITLMKVGGKSTLLIPSHLAYGTTWKISIYFGILPRYCLM